MRRAVSFFVEAGASAADALAAATSVAAQTCGLDDRKGLLRKGYDADIIVVNGDVSRRTTAGRNRAIASRASTPVAASPTTSKPSPTSTRTATARNSS